jgi:acyl-CoA synthetase (AMP-forming)/AMP-acid ligase II/7-keto-8-aminopelargonate synthetase-like enzyme/acyl carrier protein
MIERTDSPMPSPASLVDLLRWRALHQPERLAYTFLIDGEVEGDRYTYAALDLRVRSIAAKLQELGAAGERVLLLYPAGLDYIAAFFGCLYAGAIAVPAYPPRKNRSMGRIEGIVGDADARITLTNDLIVGDIEDRFAEDEALRGMTVLSTDRIPLGLAETWRDPGAGPDTIAFLQYTSGSTGTPKGVMVSHGNLLHNEEQIRQAFGTGPDSVVIGWLPLYHDMGLIGNILNPLYLGYPCYFMAPVAFLQKPARWLDAISKYRGTISGGPNFAYDLCARKITPDQREGLDLTSWVLAYNGAEPVSSDTLDRFIDAFSAQGFAPTSFAPCYGLAEATLFVASNRHQSPIHRLRVRGAALEQNKVVPAKGKTEDVRVLVSCGTPWLDQDVQIVDAETGTRRPEGSVGEIWLSGPNIAQGYWKRPEETEHTFRAALADRPGKAYMRTGDLGFVQAGHLYVTGRLKDLIIIRGRNHYPQDIEKTVEESHPALEEGAAAAFSLTIDGQEKLAVAIEVKRTHLRGLNVDEIAKAIRKAVSEIYELQVQTIALLKPKTLPKTSSGKIQRHATRSGLLAGTLELVGHHALETRLEEEEEMSEAFLDRGALAALPHNERKTLVTFFLQQLVAKALKRPFSGIDANQSLSVLGLDSLDTVELKLEIERNLKVTVPMDEDLNDLSLSDLADKLSYAFTGAPTPAPAPSSRNTEKKDLFDKCDTDGGYFGKYRLQKDRYFTQPILEGTPAPRMKFRGQDVVIWSINNYLGLIGNETIQKTAEEAIRRHGIWSPMGSRMLSGNTERHLELERRMARYLQKEASIVFNYGYMGVMGTIDALVDGNDAIVIDSLSHACIVDGALVASNGKPFRVFRHNDMNSLEDQLQKANESRKGGVLVVTEGVFGMTGDIGRLDEICTLKERYGARLFVDDAHGFGIMGPTGAGVGEMLGCQDRIDLYFGTFAKSFAAIGGVTAGDERVIDYIRYNARTQIFAKSLPMIYVESVMAALDLVEHGDALRARMWHIAQKLRDGLVALGFDVGQTASPITPVYIPAGDEQTATEAMHLLRTKYGIFVSAVTYPVVPKGVVLFRMTSTAAHSDEDVERTLEAFRQLREHLQLEPISGDGHTSSVPGNLVEPTR